jgi:hypothetical protein
MFACQILTNIKNNDESDESECMKHVDVHKTSPRKKYLRRAEINLHNKS